MKLTISQSTLLPALQKLGRIIPAKPPLPILSSLLFTAQKKEVVLQGTDLSFGITITLPAQVETEGRCAILAKPFLEIIQSLGKEDVLFSLEKGKFSIQSREGKAQLQVQDATDFPEFPQFPPASAELSLSLLESIEKDVLFSVSSDITRPILNALLLKQEAGQLTVVGTDGFRLSVLTSPFALSLDQSELLIPLKVFSELCRGQNKDKAPKFGVSNELKQLFFQWDDAELSARAVDGEFPPYQKIIPTSFKTECVTGAEELLDQVKRALVFARDSSNIVKFKIAQGGVTIQAQSSTLGEYTGVCEAQVKTEEAFDIAFNARYLLDFLSLAGDRQIWIGLNESLKPVVFKIEGEENFLYIVMPFRVSE